MEPDVLCLPNVLVHIVDHILHMLVVRGHSVANQPERKRLFLENVHGASLDLSRYQLAGVKTRWTASHHLGLALGYRESVFGREETLHLALDVIIVLERIYYI